MSHHKATCPADQGNEYLSPERVILEQPNHEVGFESLLCAKNCFVLGVPE